MHYGYFYSSFSRSLVKGCIFVFFRVNGMKETELLYYFPYKIDKENNFRYYADVGNFKGIFMVFFAHLLVHLILQKYIPAIYTTIVSLAYCLFSLTYMIENNIFQVKDILLWTVIGFVIIAVNLIFAHKLAFWFDKKFKK